MSVASSTFDRDKSSESAVVDLVRNPSVIIEEFDFTNALVLDDNVPDIQHSGSSLDVEISSSHSIWADHQGYFTTFSPEMDFIAKIENLVEKGNALVHMLYTYRSVSQAIPEISMDLPADATSDQQAEANAKRAEINRKVLDILRPEIVKVKELTAYLLQAVSLFHSVITHLTNKENNKEIVPEGVYLSLVKLMDVLLILDNLKDIKTCLQKDFSRYKRVVGAHPSIEILEEIQQLQVFVSNPDPRKAKNYVFLSLRDEIKRVNGHENVFLDCLEVVLATIEKGLFVTPEEQFRLVRVLPYFMLVCDGETDEAKSFNIFKTTKIKLVNLQRVFKKYPVVPLYGDMNICMEIVLRRSGHYDSAKMGTLWGMDTSYTSPSSTTGTNSNTNASVTSVPIPAQYDLKTNWVAIREGYSVYVTRFSAAINRYEKYPFQKVLDEVGIDMSASVYTLVVDGLQLISKWTAQVKLMLSWKYMHPCSLEHLNSILLELNGTTTTNSSVGNSAVEGGEYARVLKYNLSKEELSVLIDVISLIKSLSSLLARSEATLVPYIRFHIHHRIQTLVQVDMTPLLHKVDKKNRPILPTLLKIRSLVADWSDHVDDKKLYKEYTKDKKGATLGTTNNRKTGSNNTSNQLVSTYHPARVVSTAYTQLYILRMQISTLCDSHSELRTKSSIFGKSDMDSREVELFTTFYTDSFYFSYALHYAQTLSSVSDLSDLWYREHYLELTKCIQFPIDYSLPWILVEHILNKNVTNIPCMENVLFLLDIYNDAAHRALYILNQQYLYDEIEAESNLVIDQLYFLLSEEIYTYYKNLSASSVLDAKLKNKLENLKQNTKLTVDASRIHTLLQQKHIQLLGRSINFSFILAQNINNKIYRDIDLAIKRFESGDVRGVCELKVLLDLIEQTHRKLSEYLKLDAFETMLSEVNESFCPSSFRGRISLHMLSSLAKDIFPNFSYNHHTKRFIPSPIAIRPMHYSKAPKQSQVAHAYGGVCNKVFESCAKLTRGFFGLPHLEAYLALGVSLTDLSMVIDQILKNLCDKIVDVSEYLEALKDGVPPCDPPKFLFQTVGGYGYYEGKLRAILDYDDLKPEVFQNFREIGNSIAFLHDLSDLLEVQEQFDFVLIAPFLGVGPSGGATATATTSTTNNTTSSAPLLRVVTHLSQELRNNPRLAQDSLRAQDVWTRLPAVVTRLCESAMTVVGNTQETEGKSGKSLIKYVLLRIEEFLYQENLTVEWASFPAGTTEAFPVRNATGFHRLWSALSFLFCIVDGAGETATTEQGGEVPATATLISNEAEFGHGFTIAGCLLLHLLGQRSAFDVLDFSLYVLQLHAHETCMKVHNATTSSTTTSLHPSTAPKVDQSLIQETNSFVTAARTQQLLQMQLFAVLEGLHKTKQSYTKHSTSTVRFHPPAEN